MLHNAKGVSRIKQKEKEKKEKLKVDKKAEDLH